MLQCWRRMFYNPHQSAATGQVSTGETDAPHLSYGLTGRARIVHAIRALVVSGRLVGRLALHLSLHRLTGFQNTVSRLDDALRTIVGEHFQEGVAASPVLDVSATLRRKIETKRIGHEHRHGLGFDLFHVTVELPALRVSV